MSFSDFLTFIKSLTNSQKVITDDTRDATTDSFFLIHNGNVRFASSLAGVGLKAIICPASLCSNIVQAIGTSVVVVDNVNTFTADQLQKTIVFSINDDEFSIGRILASFYNAQPNDIIAVTGTNGKASSVSFIRQLLCAASEKPKGSSDWFIPAPCVSIQNTEVILDRGHLRGGVVLTTPSATDLHRIFAAAKEEAGVEYAVFEASSHGIHQGRLDGLKISVAAFTQLAQDHLDYHHTMEEYFEAKKLLFSKYLSEDGVAVINADIPECLPLLEITKKRNIKTVLYGESERATTVRLIKKLEKDPLGAVIKLAIAGQSFVVRVPFICDFQCRNLLTAIGVMIALNAKPELFMDEVQNLVQVAGRMENIKLPNGEKSNVYVDYAHTPDALRVVLSDIKSTYTNGKLIVLFGCGGNRDKTKRPLMGNICSSIADVTIITDDNPRDEDPAEIRKDILTGITNALGEVIEIADRREAIEKAIKMAGKNDIVILAGRGDEKMQIFANKKEVPFVDREIATEVLLHLL